MYRSPPPDRPPKPPGTSWPLTVFVLSSMAAWALMRTAPQAAVVAVVIGVAALGWWALRDRLRQDGDADQE